MPSVMLVSILLIELALHDIEVAALGSMGQMPAALPLA
jgi:hypothetical protein